MYGRSYQEAGEPRPERGQRHGSAAVNTLLYFTVGTYIRMKAHLLNRRYRVEGEHPVPLPSQDWERPLHLRVEQIPHAEGDVQRGQSGEGDMTATESEAEPPASGSLIKVISSGRRSGLPHIVTVRFVYHDGAFYVMGGRSGADWVKNSLDSGRARLRLGEVMYEVAVALADPQERSDTFLRFSKKYGTRMANGWYAAAEVCMKLSPSGVPDKERGSDRGGRREDDLLGLEQGRPWLLRGGRRARSTRPRRSTTTP